VRPPVTLAGNDVPFVLEPYMMDCYRLYRLHNSCHGFPFTTFLTLLPYMCKLVFEIEKRAFED
jgi:hypothetical protein